VLGKGCASAGGNGACCIHSGVTEIGYGIMGYIVLEEA
jgi:hypothetical protein